MNSRIGTSHGALNPGTSSTPIPFTHSTATSGGELHHTMAEHLAGLSSSPVNA